jgi:calmodulin
MREENLRQAFMMFDKDGSGQIDANEIRALLEGEDLKGTIDASQLDNIIREVDVDGNGEINFEEFLVMMRKVT